MNNNNNNIITLDLNLSLQVQEAIIESITKDQDLYLVAVITEVADQIILKLRSRKIRKIRKIKGKCLNLKFKSKSL
jgi:hypothetical protein